MQITIVQAEIEEAIKSYVTGQIALKPGQEVTIDLKATRGAEGYQAIINVGYPSEAPAKAEPARKVITTTDLKRMHAEEEAAEAAAVGEGDTAGETEAGTANGADAGEEAPVEQPVATAPVATATAAPAAGPAKKRLFGNVVKPNNA